MVPVDGVTDTTVGRLGAAFAGAGSGGGRKLLPPLPRLRALQAPSSPPTVVTVRQALGAEAWPGMGPALLSPLPLRRAPLVTTASRPIGAHASASTADPRCAAATPSGLEVSGREQSAEPCEDVRTASAAALTQGEASMQPACHRLCIHDASHSQLAVQCAAIEVPGIGGQAAKGGMQNRRRGVLLTRCDSDLVLDGSLQRWHSPLPIDHRCVFPC